MIEPKDIEGKPYNRDHLLQEFSKIDNLLEIDKVQEAQSIFLDLHYGDAADYLDNTDHKIYENLLRDIIDKLDKNIIVYLHDSNIRAFIEAIDISNVALIIDGLDMEDTLDVMERVGEDIRDKIFDLLPRKKQQQISEGFTYPENAVGRIIEKDFLHFNKHWNVRQAIEHIKLTRHSKNDFYAAVVVDNNNKPVGNILLSTLLKGNDEQMLEDLMNPELKLASPYTEIDDLAFIFKRYALTIVPVVNKLGKLIGTVSIDSMIYIIDEQTQSDFLSLGGVNTTDLFANLYQSVKRRFPWLFINLITACITSVIINQFANAIEQLITVAIIMPVVASMGGNAGTQTMTVTVRGLSDRTIISDNFRRVIFKEVSICIVSGILLAFIGSSIMYVLFFNISLSLVFAAAVVINFTIAGLCGAGIPVLLDSISIDPAAASGVLLTALTDSLGFGIFLFLVNKFLI